MNSKRQRRQTAGNFVAGLMAGSPTGPNNSKGRSTAQPRPQIQIPSRGIGPVYEPNNNDVLSGRGGRINAHPGNVQFRQLVSSRKEAYLAKTTKKLEKAHIAAQVVQYIRELEPSGRFLKEDPDGSWYDIGDQKAIKKVGQALREDAPEVRDGKPEDFPSHGTTVSGRGGKAGAVPVPSSAEKNYEPIAFQPLDIGAVAQLDGHKMPPPANKMGLMGMGGAPKPSSAAAAAVVEQPADGDVAFRHKFYPVETSALSGVSFTPSATSGISALTDPISALSGAQGPTNHQQRGNANSIRMSQLQQLRQQWARDRALGSSGTSERLRESAGVGSSLNLIDSSDGMSWADHSLMGGGLSRQDDPSVASRMSFATYAQGVQMSDQEQMRNMTAQQYGRQQIQYNEPTGPAEMSPMELHLSQGGGAIPNEYSTHYQQQNQQRNVSSSMSLASLSLAGSIPSIGGMSGVSDISESLLALDLATESSLAGILEE